MSAIETGPVGRLLNLLGSGIADPEVVEMCRLEYAALLHVAEAAGFVIGDFEWEPRMGRAPAMRFWRARPETIAHTYALRDALAALKPPEPPA